MGVKDIIITRYDTRTNSASPPPAEWLWKWKSASLKAVAASDGSKQSKKVPSAGKKVVIKWAFGNNDDSIVNMG